MEFALLKSSEVENKIHLPVLLPIGAIEQHGPHLPLATDTIIAEALVCGVDKLIGDRVLVLPVMAIGHSPEHVGFPGTLSLAAETLIATINDIANWLEKSGFQRLVLVNTHGGNDQLLQSVIKRHKGQIKIENYEGDTSEKIDQTILEMFGGIDWHAGDSESSLIAAILPNYNIPPTDGSVQPDHDQFPEEVRSIAKNGVLNHRELITIDADKGSKLLNLMVQELKSYLETH